MARIKKAEARKLKRYVWKLFEEVVKSQCKGVTSHEISSHILDKLKVDVKNRVNAILAIGAEIGLVSMKPEGRYIMKRGVTDLDKLLDAIG